jgi:hypothetical protein
MSDRAPKGLHQFIDTEQQRAWLDGEIEVPDGERPQLHESLEQRFKYAARFEKLLRRPQAGDVLDILRLYGASCIPFPRTTERFYWSVSCLPSTDDKPLVRVNASWMELFTLLPDYSSNSASPLVGEVGGGRPASAGHKNQESRLPAEQSAGAAGSAPPPNPPHKGEGLSSGLRSRFILHLSDFTVDGSDEPDHLDPDLLDRCAGRPEDVSHAFWRRPGILIVKIRGAESIRRFIADPRSLRAIRNFNLTHMNRGRNAYQASHCYSVADVMVGE